MPFLAPLIPAIAGGIASAAAGAGVNALTKGAQSTPGQVNLNDDATQAGMGNQAQLANALQSAGGVSNEQSVYNQQQQLANQLGQMSQGAGPNPALAQLAQTTGQNVSNQAALMAGQRGAGSNAGLIARQAGQQGAATEQQAVGQAATLRAQQQLNAIGALQAQQGQLAGLSTTQVNQQQAAANAQTQSALAQQQQQLQQAQGVNDIAQKQGQQQAGIIGQIGGGIASGLGTAVTSALNSPSTPAPAPSAGANYANQLGLSAPQTLAEGGQVQTGFDSIKKENYKGKSKMGRMMYAGGGQIDMKVGGHVPGKAKVGGAKDSYSNDTVPAILSPGEIVLPRSVTQSANPTEAAAKFVASIKSKKKGK